jgi:hypothetical protein
MADYVYFNMSHIGQFFLCLAVHKYDAAETLHSLFGAHTRTMPTSAQQSSLILVVSSNFDDLAILGRTPTMKSNK